MRSSSVLAVALVLLLVGCTTRQLDTSTPAAPAAPWETLQPADETILVQLGRTYEHSFPAGYYLVYALNNAGDQPLTLTLVPDGQQDMALVLTRAGEPDETILLLDDAGAGGTETAAFQPEAGVTYRLLVVEMNGADGVYALTVGP